MVLDSYFVGTVDVEFDYSLIRGLGEPIKGFGGISSGPDPLEEINNKIKKILDINIGQPITVTTIVDIMNLIGKCVVAGNVRRTAEIVFGDPHSEEYLDLKNYKKNPHREDYGWTSNNSVFAELGMDYTDICKRIVDNGEPGIAWLDNMRKYSRMKNGGDNKDHRVAGGNPCVVGDTLVNTDKGKLTVEEVVELVKNGEEIKALTFNENTLSLEYNVITNAWLSRKDVSIMTLEIEEDGNIYKLTCTPVHKVYTTNKGYVEAKDLTEDDNIKIIT
jgi:uncharacterized protein (DUF433 family)